MSSQAASNIFASRTFALFYTGQTLGYLGDGLRTIAIPLLVFHLTGSAVSLSITYALEFAPYAFFSVIGGSLADRLDRRKLMIACDAARFVIMTLFVVTYARGIMTIPLLYAGILVLAICGSVFLGGQSTSIPFILGKDRAKQAVSALVATEQAVNLVGPPLGGALFALTGPLPALAINALTYLASQGTLAAVKTLGPENPSGLPTWTEIRDDIAAGFRFVAADRAMAWLCALQTVMNFFGLMGFAAIIPFLKVTLAATDQEVGIAFGTFALGAMAGSVVAGRAHWHFGQALWIATLIDGLVWMPLAFIHVLPVAIVFIAASSACGTFAITNIIAWRMRVIPEELVGRVFGAIRLIVILGTAPGAIAGGLIAQRCGPPAAIFVSGIGYLIGAIGVATIKEIRADTR